MAAHPLTPSPRRPAGPFSHAHVHTHAQGGASPTLFALDRADARFPTSAPQYALPAASTSASAGKKGAARSVLHDPVSPFNNVGTAGMSIGAGASAAAAATPSPFSAAHAHLRSKWSVSTATGSAASPAFSSPAGPAPSAAVAAGSPLSPSPPQSSRKSAQAKRSTADNENDGSPYSIRAVSLDDKRGFVGWPGFSSAQADRLHIANRSAKSSPHSSPLSPKSQLHPHGHSHSPSHLQPPRALKPTLNRKRSPPPLDLRPLTSAAAQYARAKQVVAVNGDADVDGERDSLEGNAAHETEDTEDLAMRPSCFEDSDDESAGLRIGARFFSAAARKRLMRPQHYRQPAAVPVSESDSHTHTTHVRTHSSALSVGSTASLASVSSSSTLIGGADDAAPLKKHGAGANAPRTGRKRALSVEVSPVGISTGSGSAWTFESARLSAAKLLAFGRQARLAVQSPAFTVAPADSDADAHRLRRRRSASAEPALQSCDFVVQRSPVLPAHDMKQHPFAAAHGSPAGHARTRSAFTGTGAEVIRRPEHAFQSLSPHQRAAPLPSDSEAGSDAEMASESATETDSPRPAAASTMSPRERLRALGAGTGTRKQQRPARDLPTSPISSRTRSSTAARLALAAAAADEAEQRRLRGSASHSRVSRRVSIRAQRPSKELPPLPETQATTRLGLLLASALRDTSPDVPMDADDGDLDEPELSDDDGVDAEVALAAAQLLQLQHDSDFPVGSLMRAAAQLRPATAQQNNFAPVPQGIHRLDSAKHSPEDSTVALVVGDRTFNTNARVLCGSGKDSVGSGPGLFARYVSDCLEAARWLTAVAPTEPTRRHSSLLSPSTLFSPGAFVDSYLEMDIDEQADSAPLDSAWPDSEPGTPLRPSAAAAARQAQISHRLSLASTWKALEDQSERAIAESVNALCSPPRPQQQQQDQAQPQQQTNQAVHIELFLDRPPAIYELLLWVLAHGRLPTALVKGGIAGNTDLQARILEALREEASFLGYAHVGSLIERELSA